MSILDGPDGELSGSALDEPTLRKLRRALERAVRGVCPPWLREQREDIVQNALMRVVRILESDEEKRIWAHSYLWKLAFTETAAEIRRRRVRREEPMEPEHLEREPARGDPEQAAASREIGLAIVDCLGGVIESRRRPVLLKLYGFGLTETARLLGLERKRVDNLLYRGLADLRRCLQGKGIRP